MILRTGEMSDTQIFQMLKRAEVDGRPLVIFSLGDFDPAGNQMAVSIARKVQAFAETIIDIDAQVFAPALTLEQCKEWNLPSTELKKTEKRAVNWVYRWSWGQTELDAAVALVPNEFQKSIWQAMQVFWDVDIGIKNEDARAEMLIHVAQKMDQYIDGDELKRIRESVEGKLSELDSLVDGVNDALRIEVPWVDTPDQQPGEAEGSDGWLQSTENWMQSTDRMRERNDKA